MPTPLLAMRYKTGATPQVVRYVTGTPANQGVTFGALETASTTDEAHQRVIRFLGHSTWIALVANTIQRSTDAGATYTPVVTDADLGTSHPNKAGPYLAYVNGVATLVIVSRATASSVNRFLWTSTDGVTWVKSGPFVLVGAPQSAIHDVVFWRGAFYGSEGSTPVTAIKTIVWNPGALTVALITPAAPPQNAEAALCVFNDRLFGLWVTNGTNRLDLYELVGGAWTIRITGLIAAANSAPSADAKWCLFVDGVNLIAIGVNTTLGAWRVFSIDSALASTDVTTATDIATVLGAATATSSIAPLVDAPDPGSGAVPRIYLYQTPNRTVGTGFSIARWEGIATAMVSVGSGGDVAHAMPFGVQNGGSPFWTSGQRHIERVSATAVLGGVRYGFKIYSPNASVDSVSVRWIKTVATGEYPLTPFATLASPSAGTLTGGNTITGLDAADNGATTFFVTWMASTDGYSIGDSAKTTPEIFS
jgi:hypothetical protein